MAEALPRDGRPRLAALKVTYLLAVMAAVFGVPAIPATRPAQWLVLPALLAVQVLALLANGAGLRGILRPVGRLKWLFAFLVLCYTLLPPSGPAAAADATLRWPPGAAWAVPLHLGGLAQAGLMCLQITTLILASAVVRQSDSGAGLSRGLRAVGLPPLFVHAFDVTLDLLGGPRQPGAREREAEPAAPTSAPGFLAGLGRLLRGDIGIIVQPVRGGLERSRARVMSDAGGRLDPGLAHDVATVAGVALVMASLKMVKVLPGVPFAPGIKAVLLFPLYALAARRTHSRWGATATGGVLGAISFLQGDGRYGVLDVFQHLAPGVVYDLAEPLVRRLRPSPFVYCPLGFAAAVARTGTELLVVFLLGARAEVYLFPAAKLIPNLIAGTLSGFVSAYVLKAVGGAGPEDQTQSETAGPGEPIGPGAAAAIQTPPSLPLNATGAAGDE